jgi:hypothetical protein
MISPSIAVAPPPLRRKGIPTYDHTAFYPTIRKSDVFLCSYPKSGTTWLGFLIAQAIKQGDDEALDLKSFNQYVPDVNDLWTKRGSLAGFDKLCDPRFFLCHATCDRKLPKVVCMLRDPRDVMVSYWHYRHFLEKDFALPLADFLAGDDHWPCEWDDHVSSWMFAAERHPNLLIVRYEDLHTDTAGVLRNVLKFAGAKCSEARLNAAVDASRFENMRAAEESGGVHGKKGDPEEHFVRKGRVGSWQEEMGFADLRIIEEKYGKVMHAAGYEPLS